MARNSPRIEYIKDRNGILCCPFCGDYDPVEDRHHLTTVNDGGWMSIRCDSCGCNPDMCNVTTIEGAIKNWNSRVVGSEDSAFKAGIEFYKRYLTDLMRNEK